MSDTDNSEDMIDIWLVENIAFKDRDEAIEHAENLLSNVFDELEEDDGDLIFVERRKMLRSYFDRLEEV